MLYFCAYLLVAVGNFIGLQSSGERKLGWDIVLAFTWPIIVILTLLISLGIIKVQIPPKK